MAGMYYLVTVIIGIISGFIGSILNQDRVRWYERKALANALIAEIVIIGTKLSDLSDELNNMRNINNIEFFKQSNLFPISIIKKPILTGIPPMEMLDSSNIVVFSSNTSKIGLFDTYDVTDIINFYSRLKSLMNNCENINKIIGDYVFIDEIEEHTKIQIILLSHRLVTICNTLRMQQKGIIRSLELYNNSLFKHIIIKFKSKVKNVRFPYRELWKRR